MTGKRKRPNRAESNYTAKQVAGIMAALEQEKPATSKWIAQNVLGLKREEDVKRARRNIDKTYRRRVEENVHAREMGKPVDWDDIEMIVKAKVQKEHLPALRLISAWARTTFGTDLFDTTPSYRSLRWQSHILTHTNTITTPDDIWILGEIFGLRELATVYMGKPITKDDLEWWLSYGPWESDQREQQYLKAIRDGLIPKLTSTDNRGDMHVRQFYKVDIATILANLAYGHEHLLPSIQRMKYREQTGKDSIDLRFQIGEKTKDLSIGL